MNIFKIRLGTSNTYIIKDKNGCVMIDCGNRGKIKTLFKKSKEINIDIKEIKYIILTHTHYDHVGCINEIKEKSGAQILVHEAEKDFLINGFTPFPNGTNRFTGLIAAFSRKYLPRMGKYEPVSPDIVFSDQYHLPEFDIRIIHTPGHSIGSITIIAESKHAFVGDTMFGVFLNSVMPPYADDKATLLESWKKILTENCREYFPGHGKMFTTEKLIKTLKKHS